MAAKEAAQAHDIEGARLEAEATLEGARRRADAEARAADQALAEARQEAAAIRADAERQRTTLLEQARAEAAAAEVIRQPRCARQDRGRASEESERILAEARSAAERELTTAERDASNVWPRSAPRLPSWQNACESKPTRSYASTPTADAARPTARTGRAPRDPPPR